MLIRTHYCSATFCDLAPCEIPGSLLMIDESTDKATMWQMIVIARELFGDDKVKMRLLSWRQVRDLLPLASLQYCV